MFLFLYCLYVLFYISQIPGKQIAVYSLGGNLTGHNWTASVTASLMGAIHACYHHAIAPDLQVGVELETNYAQQESTTNVGFQYEIPKVTMVRMCWLPRDEVARRRRAARDEALILVQLNC